MTTSARETRQSKAVILSDTATTVAKANTQASGMNFLRRNDGRTTPQGYGYDAFGQGGLVEGAYTVLDSARYGGDIATETKKVVLVPFKGSRGDDMVVFEATPSLTESGSTTYSDIVKENARSPAQLLSFQTSLSRDFQISAKLVSRTVAEAEETFRKIHLLKSWRMPDEAGGGGGEGSGQRAPLVIALHAYGRMIQGVPTVVKSLNIEYPDDVDYIDIGHSKIAIIHNISIQLTETRTSDEIALVFNSEAFRTGSLPTW